MIVRLNWNRCVRGGSGDRANWGPLVSRAALIGFLSTLARSLSFPVHGILDLALIIVYTQRKYPNTRDRCNTRRHLQQSDLSNRTALMGGGVPYAKPAPRVLIISD